MLGLNTAICNLIFINRFAVLSFFFRFSIFFANFVYRLALAIYYESEAKPLFQEYTSTSQLNSAILSQLHRRQGHEFDETINEMARKVIYASLNISCCYYSVSFLSDTTHLNVRSFWKSTRI